jgi:DNA-binding protein H-NS
MPASLASIESQIARLQKAADALRQRQKDQVIKQVMALMADNGLSADDLIAALSSRAAAGKGQRGARTGDATAKAPKAAKAAKPGKAARAKPGTDTTRGRVVPVKFRDDAGNVWSGRGSQPKWFVAALAAGKTPDDLRVPAAA